MRLITLLLFGFLPMLLSAQADRLDHGRMDPAWFGPGMIFERSTRVYFLWIRPGLALQGRSLQVRSWEAPGWIVKPRSEKDQVYLQRLEPILVPALVAGLQAELREALPVSMDAGDVILTGRVTDCLASGVGAMFGGLGGIYFDLKLTDAQTGDLLVGVHHFIEGATAESVQARYEAWSRQFAQVLAERTLPPLKPRAAVPLKVPAPTPSLAPQLLGPTGDLDAILRRLEALRRDGLLKEDEYQLLRKQAVEKAMAPK